MDNTSGKMPSATFLAWARLKLGITTSLLALFFFINICVACVLAGLPSTQSLDTTLGFFDRLEAMHKQSTNTSTSANVDTLSALLFGTCLYTPSETVPDRVVVVKQGSTSPRENYHPPA